MTVVALDDCMTAVTATPSRTPFIGLSVIFSSSFSSFPPDAFSRPLPIYCIPKRKSASPPKSDNTEKMSIFFPFTCQCFVSLF